MAQTNKIPANPKSHSFDVTKAQNVIFQPNPGPQTEFLAASEQEVLYGGAAGGGKSFAMLADPLRGMNDPNFSGLLLRRTNDELRDLKNTSKQLYPKAIPGIKWSEKDSTWYTPQGASLWMTYLDRDDDVTRFQGQQYSWIGFDELTQWPSPYPWDYLRSRLRSATGLPLYQRATTNPGGRGHCLPFGEVLTEHGWVDIKKVKAGDKVISVDSKGQQATKEVTDTIKEYYEGNLVFRKDEMVFTENHRLPFVNNSGNIEIRPFTELPGQCSTVRAAYPSADFTSKTFFTVPSYKTRRLRLNQPDSILYSDYAELMGWFLSEGHTLDRDKEFGISQTKEHNRKKIKDLLIRCGFKFRESSTGFQISSPKWWNYLRQFGKCRDKFIPRELMSSLFLKDFFKALMDGDGYWTSSRSGTYYTISEKLADDVMEVGIRLGYSTRLFKRQREGREGLSYEVRFSDRKTTELNTGNHLYRVETNNSKVNCNKSYFEGFVYCLTVPDTETFFVRQNGYVWLSGNTWVKKMFIDPAPPGKAFWGTDITTGEPLKYPDNHSKFPGHFVVKRRFIPAKLYDNPYLSEDGAYEANLLSLPEFQRKQLLEGSWDIVDGAAFAEFNRHLHVIEPFEIPNNWPRFRGADYGYSDASCVLWFAVSPSEQLIVYREFYQRGVLAEDLGYKIVEAEEEDRTRIKYGVLDSSTWANRGDRGPSIAEQINGILRDNNHKVFRPSDRSKGSRVAGKNEIHRRLKVNQFTEEPGLVIFNTCRELITQLPAIPLDRNNPEDVDTHSEDHAYDALRYGVMTRPKSSVWDHTAPKSDGFAAFDKTFGY